MNPSGNRVNDIPVDRLLESYNVRNGINGAEVPLPLNLAHQGPLPGNPVSIYNVNPVPMAFRPIHPYMLNPVQERLAPVHHENVGQAMAMVPQANRNALIHANIPQNFNRIPIHPVVAAQTGVAAVAAAVVKAEAAPQAHSDDQEANQAKSKGRTKKGAKKASKKTEEKPAKSVDGHWPIVMFTAEPSMPVNLLDPADEGLVYVILYNCGDIVTTARMDLFRKTNRHTNVAVNINKTTYYLHQVTLCSASDYFDRLLQSPNLQAGSNLPTVHFNSEEFSVLGFDLVIDIIYQGIVRIPRCELSTLLSMLEKLQVRIPDNSMVMIENFNNQAMIDNGEVRPIRANLEFYQATCHNIDKVINTNKAAKEILAQTTEKAAQDVYVKFGGNLSPPKPLVPVSTVSPGKISVASASGASNGTISTGGPSLSSSESPKPLVPVGTVSPGEISVASASGASTGTISTGGPSPSLSESPELPKTKSPAPNKPSVSPKKTPGPSAPKRGRKGLKPQRIVAVTEEIPESNIAGAGFNAIPALGSSASRNNSLNDIANNLAKGQSKAAPSKGKRAKENNPNSLNKGGKSKKRPADDDQDAKRVKLEDGPEPSKLEDGPEPSKLDPRLQLLQQLQNRGNSVFDNAIPTTNSGDERPWFRPDLASLYRESDNPFLAANQMYHRAPEAPPAPQESALASLLQFQRMYQLAQMMSAPNPEQMAAFLAGQQQGSPGACGTSGRKRGRGRSDTKYTGVIGPNGKPQVQCQICNKILADPSSLYRHKKIHTEDKRHVCGVCQRGFIQRYNMTQHMHTHFKYNGANAATRKMILRSLRRDGVFNPKYPKKYFELTRLERRFLLRVLNREIPLDHYDNPFHLSKKEAIARDAAEPPMEPYVEPEAPAPGVLPLPVTPDKKKQKRKARRRARAVPMADLSMAPPAAPQYFDEPKMVIDEEDGSSSSWSSSEEEEENIKAPQPLLPQCNMTDSNNVPPVQPPERLVATHSMNPSENPPVGRQTWPDLPRPRVSIRDPLIGQNLRPEDNLPALPTNARPNDIFDSNFDWNTLHDFNTKF